MKNEFSPKMAFFAGLILILLVVPAQAGITDLNITSIAPNGNNIFANVSNTYSVKIVNEGSEAVENFDVTTRISGGWTFENTTAIATLAAGANTTIRVKDPTIPDYGSEWVLTASIDGGDEEAVTGTVVYNGYMGKRYTDGSDITTVRTYNLRGNIIYSAGDSYYLSAYAHKDWTNYEVHWSADNLSVPDGATVEEARLYVPYTWDKGSVFPDNISLTFNGIDKDDEVWYHDEKGFGTSYPYGMTVYDVTEEFSTEENNATLINNHDGGGMVSVRGMMLVVVYGDNTEIVNRIFINEGFDLLYGGEKKYTTPEKATAYAPFTGLSVDSSSVASAKLITFAPGAGPDEGELIFNGQKWDDVWNFAGETQIGVDERETKDYLLDEGNTAAFQSSGDYMEAGNAILILAEKEDPYILVTGIESNCDQIFAHTSNQISATIMNRGTADAGEFNVTFSIDGETSEVTVDGLAGRNSTTVVFTDPADRNYGDEIAVTATTDDDTTGQSFTTSVVYNGYMGKRYTDGSDITTVKTYDLQGDLIYSAGDSYYLSAYAHKDWTNYEVYWSADNLSVPDGATVEEARLYVPYTWDKGPIFPDEISLTFNGIDKEDEVWYHDEKGFGTSYPYGMTVYNVTEKFSTEENNAILTNNRDGGGAVSIRGMMLVVVYSDDTKSRKQITINENFDLLYGGVKKCTTSDEATAYSPFTGLSIDNSSVASARLITFAPGAGPDEGELLFNGHTWDNVWNFAGKTQIGVDEREVKEYLLNESNTAAFRSSADYMEASNAILVVDVPSDHIVLNEGWNFISVPRPLVKGSDTISLFDHVDCGGHSILMYDAKNKLWKKMGADDTIKCLDGIWVYAAEPAAISLMYDENAVATVPPVKELAAGWNAIGSSCFGGETLVDASAHATLMSVESQWATVFAFDSDLQKYDISIIKDDKRDHSDERLMPLKQGFWVYMTSEGTLAAI